MILYEKGNKIIFYDELFLYQCYLDKSEKNFVEIKDIEFIKKNDGLFDSSGKKIKFQINNSIIIFFDKNDEGIKNCKHLEEKFKDLKACQQNFEQYNLKNILNYVENL